MIYPELSKKSDFYLNKYTLSFTLLDRGIHNEKAK